MPLPHSAEPNVRRPVLETRRASKAFGSVAAVSDVSIKFHSGEIHAVLGENGAGKSTLMNLIYGIYQPDSGEMLIDGVLGFPRRPEDAIKGGVGMVHQHLKLVPSFTVAESIALANFRDLGVRLRKDQAERLVNDLAAAYRLDVSPQDVIADLPLGVRQRVEILAVLSRKPKILILDEPTTVLAPTEIENLHATLRTIVDAGHSVVLITHRLSEVFDQCDAISVMRKGHLVWSGATVDRTPDQIMRMMVGRNDDGRGTASSNSPALEAGAEVLAIQGVVVPPSPGSTGLNEASLAVRSREILAVAGVEGNGQRELVEVLGGVRKPSSGMLSLGGRVTDLSVRGRGPASEIGVVPEDRQQQALVLNLSVAENLVLGSLSDRRFTRFGLLRLSAMRAFCNDIIRDFDITCSGPDAPMASLSGGNQQKVVLARALVDEQEVVVVSQPTRGLDFAAADSVISRLQRARDRGAAVLFISSDLEEVLLVGDRVGVIRGGVMGQSLPRREATREALGSQMTGASSAGSGGHDSD